MQSQASTVSQYIEEIPDDRRPAFERLVVEIRQQIDPQFTEQMGYGNMGWVVPHQIFPAGYHCDPKLPVPFLGLASQKNYIALYHMGLYADPGLLAWFQQEYVKTGLKLDMGKSCIRFKRMGQIPYTLIGQLVAKMSLQDFLNLYTEVIARPSPRSKK
jgi:uncharacterized protein YdhG (YjbR/CyaY superfamily)